VMGGFGRMEPLDLMIIRRLVNAKPSYTAPQAGDNLDFRRSVAFRAMLYALQLKLVTLPPRYRCRISFITYQRLRLIT
jgi:hypothetical protein